MKIGVISDIHAQVENLRLALAQLEAAGVDQVVCAGDLVEGGVGGDEVVRLIVEREIPAVLGNHDASAYHEQDWLRRTLEAFGEIDRCHLLDPQTIALVDDLPLSRRFTWEGVQVFLAHGTPWSNTEYIFPEVSPGKARRVAAEAAADVCIFGHTHLPMRLRCAETWLLNPGSLQRNRTEDRRTYGILTLPGMHFDVYDLETHAPIALSTIALDAQE